MIIYIHNRRFKCFKALEGTLYKITNEINNEHRTNFNAFFQFLSIFQPNNCTFPKS